MSGLTLANFLSQRLDEDEAAAQAVAKEQGRDLSSAPIESALDPEAVAGWAEAPMLAIDPTRVLAEVVSKRGVLTDYAVFKSVTENAPEDSPLPQALTAAGIVTGYERALRHLAAVYREHGDYRSEWAP